MINKETLRPRLINFILTYNIKNTEETDELNIELQ